MSFKKAKLFSGILSVTALASMTGAPVLANEVVQDGLSGTAAQDEASAEAGNGTIAAFLGADANTAGNPAAENGAQNEDPFLAVFAEEIGEKEEESAAEEAEEISEGPVMTAPLRELAEETEDSDIYLEAAAGYNAAVLPELTVSLGKGNVMTGFGAQDLCGQFAQAPFAASIAVDRPEAANQKLVVASPNVYLNLHAEPSLGSKVVGKMYGNDVAVALRTENDRWTRVRSGNIVGYALNEYLVEGDQAQALSEIVSRPLATIAEGEDRNVYQEASDTSKIIAAAAEGDQYEVLESENGWLGILTEDGEGYIPASDVTLSMAYPVAESSRQEADRISRSNVKERADHEERKAQMADAVAQLAKTRADVASGEDEETAMAVVEVALRAADAAAAQADVARVAVSQAGEESGQAVIEFATQFIGNPYVWGGSSLTHGADCSGFVMAVYGNFGFRLPHYDVSDRSVGSPVASLAEARAGDIICYYGHVALYMGDGMIVHAQDERHGITTSRADFMHIVCIRRLFT